MNSSKNGLGSELARDMSHSLPKSKNGKWRLYSAISKRLQEGAGAEYLQIRRFLVLKKFRKEMRPVMCLHTILMTPTKDFTHCIRKAFKFEEGLEHG